MGLLPPALPKCISDQVQSHVRVVRAAQGLTEPGVTPLRPRTRPSGRTLQHLPMKPRNMHADVGTFKPIRIQTWVVEESDGLSDTESGRLSVAVGQAIPDDHLAGCDLFPEADSPRRVVLRPQGAGLPDTDFLLYLRIQTTDKCRAAPQVFAYAVHCQVDTSSRPVAGLVVICKDRLAAKTYGHLATVQVMIHEIFHILGFSKDLFATWRVCSSSQGCSHRGKVTHTDRFGQMRLFTPSVIATLQRHLASQEQELGGPLENQDEAASGVSSHWESRVLQGSIMAAMLEEPSTVRIDPVTLAAFQDMGWYTVNLSRAQSLVWGEGEGAMFGSPLTCRNISSSFFCTHRGPGCHYLHHHKGECQTDVYLDGCSMYKALKTGSECRNKANAEETEAHDEIYGPDSRCFFSNLTTQNQSQLTVDRAAVGRCYRHRCTGPNEYQIQVSGADWVACPAGEAVQVRGYEGSVSCPDRRLCLHPVVSRLWDDASGSDPSDQTTELEVNWSTHQKYPATLVMCTVLALTVVGLLAAVLLPHWKRSARIHPAPLDHTGP
ncbi:ciliated left-right organizer metallopeptidase [Neosynchiropus ocellatus]